MQLMLTTHKCQAHVVDWGTCSVAGVGAFPQASKANFPGNGQP